MILSTLFFRQADLVYCGLQDNLRNLSRLSGNVTTREFIEALSIGDLGQQWSGTQRQGKWSQKKARASCCGVTTAGGYRTISDLF